MIIEHIPAIILAGGRGTRISEYSDSIPKPLVPIGGRPILAHIINIYAAQGVNKFFIAGGYKIDELKRYFAHYHLFNSDFCLETKNNTLTILSKNSIDVSINVLDTGLDTQTGGRLKRLENFLQSSRFFLTYGDGVCNVNLQKLVSQHEKLGALATVTAVHPTSRYGKISIENDDMVTAFSEKPEFGEDWINGGFMVMESGVFKYLHEDTNVLETAILQKLSEEGKLAAHKHKGFWKSMDTLRDKRELDIIAEKNSLPWMEI